MGSVQLVRTSERSTWRRCRQKWQWSYGLGLEANVHKGALTFGTMIHRALELWYPPGTKRGIHPAETFLKLYDATGVEFAQWDDEGNKVPARELGEKMCIGYVDKYGLDEDWEIIQSEMRFEVDVYLRTGEYLATYVGRLDGVARNRRTGRLILLEHKTAKSIGHVRINSGYGEQAVSYWWGATLYLRSLGLLGESELIDSVMFNFLRKGVPDERYRNEEGHALNKPKKDALIDACRERDLPWAGAKVETLEATLKASGVDPRQFGEVSKVQGSPLFGRQELPLGSNTLATFQRRMRMELFDIRAARQGDKRMLIYKNPTKDCDWECQFRDACEVHEMGGDYEGILQMDFKKWDSYSDYELEMEKG